MYTVLLLQYVYNNMVVGWKCDDNNNNNNHYRLPCHNKWLIE